MRQAEPCPDPASMQRTPGGVAIFGGGCRVQGVGVFVVLGLRISSLGLKFWGVRFRILCFPFSVIQGLGLSGSGFGFSCGLGFEA